MRIAYADPPYSGEGYLYGRKEIRWDRLIAALESRFDGWALSTKSPDLVWLLPMFDRRNGYQVRVASWSKGRSSNGGFFNPSFSWEPVIFRSARMDNISRWKDSKLSRPTICDSITTRPLPIGFVGNKPPDFCAWMFDLLGAEPEDEFHDLFYGSGAVTKAWKQWCQLKRCGGPLFVNANEGGGA